MPKNDYDTAIRLRPRFAVAYIARAAAYAQRNDAKVATADYENYLEILPNGTKAPEARAYIAAHGE